jgi:transposase InsO family protein
MPGRLGDLEVPAHPVELGATRQELVALSKLADDLVGRMPTSGHGCCPPAPVWGNGLAHRLDHYEGVTSRWRTRAELRYEIVVWIERTYNRRRRQRALGKLTPVEFELAFTPPTEPANAA